MAETIPRCAKRNLACLDSICCVKQALEVQGGFMIVCYYVQRETTSKLIIYTVLPPKVI